ncbi:MAG: ribosome silencing factor [Acidiferrobacteraceae bacterium]
MQPRDLLKTISAVLDEAKGQDIRSLDVRKMTDIADYMVIVSGTSTRHVSALADRVVDRLREHGLRPIGVEGKAQGEWVLIDFGDVIVHVMHPQTRDFYTLEKLWSEEVAQELPVAEKAVQKPRRRTRP